MSIYSQELGTRSNRSQTKSQDRKKGEIETCSDYLTKGVKDDGQMAV
jgi:hypothetical protein